MHSGLAASVWEILEISCKTSAVLAGDSLAASVWEILDELLVPHQISANTAVLAGIHQTSSISKE